MSTPLKSMIDRLDVISARFHTAKLPEEATIAGTNRELQKMFSGAGPMPPVEDLIEVSRRIAKSAERGSYNDISNRDWQKVPWCLWLQESPLANVSSAVEGYFAWLRQRKRQRYYNILIDAYLREFDAEDRTIQQAGEIICKVLGEFPWPWLERHRNHQIFSPNEAAGGLADGMLSWEGDGQDGLSEFGLNGDARHRGLVPEAFRVMLHRYRDSVAGVDSKERLLERVLSWASVEPQFTFDNRKAHIAESLLMPWVENPNACPDSIVESSRDFLLKSLEDPRTNPGDWIGVNEDAVGVMRRWLTGLALRQYLLVVDQIAYDYQWQYRRAFWNAYYELGHMREAWVVFASDGTRIARKIFDEDTPFGQLGRNGVEQNHAVLLMKIDRLTIADWSHNGKCHIWLPGNESAPKLYEGRGSNDRYSKWGIDNGSDNGGVVHAGSPNLTWQRSVESFIRQHTNIQLNQADYRP
ncbi:MAG: hypothetical protein HOI45_20170 [Rhodospirillaceae bacterium]|jgi:hypothetical protein|nr:hypothetical protein [Rhodospirillaceae bacterium]